MRNHGIFFASAALLVAACATTPRTGTRLPDGTASEFTGGPSWTTDAFAVFWDSQVNGSAGTNHETSSIWILFGSEPNLCAIYQGDTRPASSRTLSFMVTAEGPAAPRPGEYRMRTQSFPKATARYASMDEGCGTTAAPSMGWAGGTIELDEITDDFVTGSYDIYFGHGQRMDGTFRARTCRAVKNHARVCQ